MAYIIDMHLPAFTQQGAQIIPVPLKLVPCSIVASERNPGMYLAVLEGGASIVVEPNGTQVRTVPAGQDNWDSAYTQAGLYGDKLVYRSANGVPRGYLVIQ